MTLVSQVSQAVQPDHPAASAAVSHVVHLAAAPGFVAPGPADFDLRDVFYGDTNLINTELDRYFAVKREDLQRVAKQYLTKDSMFVLRYPAASAPASK